MTERVLNTAPNNPAAKAIVDLKTTGMPDLFRLISKASSNEMGFMRSTKAFDTGDGVVLQVSTLNHGVPAESVTYVPGVRVEHGPNIDTPYLLVNSATGKPVNGHLPLEERVAVTLPDNDEADEVAPMPEPSRLIQIKKRNIGELSMHQSQMEAALNERECVVAVTELPHTAFVWNGAPSRYEAIRAHASALYGSEVSIRRADEVNQIAYNTLLINDAVHVRIGDVVVLQPYYVDVSSLHRYLKNNYLHYPHNAISEMVAENKRVESNLESSLDAAKLGLSEEKASHADTSRRLADQTQRVTDLSSALLNMYGINLRATGQRTKHLAHQLVSLDAHCKCLPKADTLRQMLGVKYTSAHGKPYEFDASIVDDIGSRYVFHAITPRFYLSTFDSDFPSLARSLESAINIEVKYDVSREEDVLIFNGHRVDEDGYVIILEETSPNGVGAYNDYIVIETGKVNYDPDDVPRRSHKKAERAAIKHAIDVFNGYVSNPLL